MKWPDSSGAYHQGRCGASSSATSWPKSELADGCWCRRRQSTPTLLGGTLGRTMGTWNRVRWLLHEENAHA